MPKRAAFLGRVSTDNQAKLDAHGLPEQRRAALAYAKANGFEIVATFEDVVSGASELRPGFYKLLARAHEFDAVIVSHTDRLARDLELGLRHMRLIREAGLELHSAARGLVEKGVVSGVDMLLSEAERERISDRTQAGLIAEARAGKLPNGLHNMGYLNIPGQNRAIPDPDKSLVVHHIFERSAEAASYRQIAREMMAAGHLTPYGKTVWHQHTVRRIVTNPTYKGEYVWNHKTAGRFVIKVPPIVSPELWAKAQKKKRGPPVRVPLPLSGYIRCGKCGMSLNIRKVDRGGKRVYLYYRCASAGSSVGPCGAGLTRRDKLEPEAERVLREALQSPELLRGLMHADVTDDVDTRRLAALEQRAERVREMRLDGLYDRATAKVKMAEIEAERCALLSQNETDYPLAEYAQAAREMPLTELLELVNPRFYVLDGSVTLELDGGG